MTGYLLNDPLFNSSSNNEKSTTATYGKTFYFASFFMNKKIAERAYGLYTFCRLLDDIADQGTEQKKCLKLATIQQKILAVQSEKIDINPALSISKQASIHFLDGLLSDQKKVRIKTVDELLIYCYQVAGTVGVMMCDAMGITNVTAIKHAIDLGIGMQLTNIARDVAEDAKMDRRYLPQSWLGNIEPSDINQASPELKLTLINATEKLLNLADCYYQSGLFGLKYLPRSCRFAIFQAATMYRAIGTDLKRNKMNNLTYRAHLTLFEKCGYLLCSVYYYRVLLKQNKSIDLHQSELHGVFSSSINYEAY
jgi:phytoene synthase